MQFNANGTGFIPGVPGAIPDSQFAYTVLDASHVSIDLNGATYQVEIYVDGDTLTWNDSLGQVVYHRSR